ncbi:hypothetical protein NUW58_g1627 [Xylaria curta]|uniref:Uncharacterized protein n=1 Tax=Xylaria curta TaxID=42375 RepID=A0ACC1PKZ3_9PEZI|nr:hypothetical protein NUW58_g1627 [Xylaria curta]
MMIPVTAESKNVASSQVRSPTPPLSSRHLFAPGLRLIYLASAAQQRSFAVASSSPLRSRRDDSDASAAHFSPPASPSMSLYSGMSPLSPLRRRFSSHSIAPSSPLYPHSESDHLGPEHRGHEDITHDSKDVLVQRLNDLAAALGRQHRTKDESISVLHAKVDELENVLYNPSYTSKTETRPPLLPSLASRANDQDGSSFSWEPPHPDTLLLSDIASLASPTRPSPSTKPGAEQVVVEAQSLYKGLEVIISNLRDRQEETEHIHALLITRLERAAQRIIELEEQLRELETERKESGTELLNLQIQLKAIEVQCLSYVPKDADQELRESIDAWKMEWSAMKQKKARNKEQFNDTPTRRRPPPTAQ